MVKADLGRGAGGEERDSADGIAHWIIFGRVLLPSSPRAVSHPRPSAGSSLSCLMPPLVWCHPWLRVHSLLRVMLGTWWEAETWPTINAELKKALQMRREIQRAGWFTELCAALGAGYRSEAPESAWKHFAWMTRSPTWPTACPARIGSWHSAQGIPRSSIRNVHSLLEL